MKETKNKFCFKKLQTLEFNREKNSPLVLKQELQVRNRIIKLPTNSTSELKETPKLQQH